MKEMNLNFLNNILQKFELLKIDKASCLKARSPKSTCNKCQEICPQDAITFKDGVNVTEDCNNCGACVAACPTGVFAISDPSDEYLYHTALHSTKMVITCAENLTRLPRKARKLVLKVECLSRLYFEMLLSLGVGVKDNVYLYCDENCCSNCEKQKTIRHLNAELKKANSILSQLEGSKNILWTKDLPQDVLQIFVKASDGFDDSRRQFFSEIGSNAKKLPFEVMSYMLHGKSESSPNLHNKVGESKKLPFKRQLLLKILQKITDKRGLEKRKLQLPGLILKVDNCYLCGVCAKLCPSSALHLPEDGNLAINYARCLGCGLCGDVCNNRAISFREVLSNEELAGEDWQIIAQSVEKVCPKCGENFKTGSQNWTGVCLRCKIKSGPVDGRG